MTSVDPRRWGQPRDAIPDSGRIRSLRAVAAMGHARDIRLSGHVADLAGIAIGALAVGVRALVMESFDDPGYILFMAAVIAAAWFAGVRGGFAALATAIVLHSLRVITDPAEWAGPIGAAEVFKGLFFIFVGLATVLLIGSRRAARDRLADALREMADLDEAVEARDQRLELVLAASDTGVWEWDMHTGRLEWSRAIYQQHGLDPTGPAPSYETYVDTIHPDDRARFHEAVSDAIDQEGRFDIEFRIVWPDGTIHWTRGAGQVFRDASGNPVRMIGTGQDITERRRLEAERDRLHREEDRARDFREAFVDVISHELRTPITTIYGLTQILARPGREDDPTERAGLLADVRAEAERLYRLVEDLLVLSRVEHGRLVVDSEPIEPRRLLERVVTSEAAALPSIVTSLEVEPHLPIVAGEATYVEQILRNLLDNAAKYSPPGTPVTVSARAEEDGVAVRVVDEGPGIPDGAADRVFELFYRDPENAHITSGSGIGLFVCASLVHAMGGRVWARRRPEGGSEFGFTLLAIAADEDLRSERMPDHALNGVSGVSRPRPPALGDSDD